MDRGGRADEGLLHELAELRKQIAELKTREMHHQKTERALRDRLFFFQRLIDTIPTPIFFKDVHGYYRGCNRAFEEYTGFRRERLIGKSADDFPSPGISPQFRHMDELLLYRPGVQGYEVTIQHTDGSFRDILFRKATLTDEEGDPAGLIGIMFDLTERKRAEEALMAALAGEENERARTESIIAAIGEAITIQDRNFRILCQNRAHIDLMGDHKGEICYRAYQQREESCPHCPLLKVIKDGGIHTQEKEVHVRGRRLFLEITASPLRDGTGEIIAGIEVVRDSTARKEAERELLYYQNHLEALVCAKTAELEETVRELKREVGIRRRAERALKNALTKVAMERAKTKAMLAAIGDGIAIIDPDFVITYQNKTHRMQIGEHTGKRCYEAFLDSDRVCEGCPVESSFRTGKVVRAEMVLRIEDREAYVDITASPLREATGRSIACIEVVRNVSERKALEEAIRESKRRLQLVIDAVPALISYVDGEQRYRFVNKRYEEWFALSVKDIVGRRIDEVFGDPVYRDLREYMERALSGERCVFERKAITREGERVLLADYVPHFVQEEKGHKELPLFSEGKRNVEGFFAITYDITERKEAEEEVRRYARNLGKLLMVSRKITATTELSILYRTVIEASRRVLSLDFSTLLLTSEDRTRLVVMDTIGFPQSLIGSFSLGQGQGLSSYVFHHRRMEAVTDFFAETRFDVPPIVKEKGISSALCVPMMLGEEVFGVIIGHTLERRIFSPDEMSLFQSIANQAAAAIRNSMNLDALKRSEEKYRDLFENAMDALFIVDSDLRYRDVNKRAVRLFGYSREEWLRMRIFDVIPPEQVPRSEAEFRKLRRKGSYEKFIGKMRRKDGMYIDVEVSSSAIWEGGRIVGSRDVVRDITERREAEEALRRSEEKYRDLFENANDLIQSVDPRGRFRYVNRAWKETLGYTDEEVARLSIFDVIYPDCHDHCMEIFAQVMQGKKFDRIEVVFMTKEGKAIALEGSVNCNFAEGGPVATRGIFRDITERKLMEEKLRDLADRDPLTNICNRRKFYEALDEEIKRSLRYTKPLSIILFDIDHFKKVNDTYGHGVGDLVLRELAFIVKENLRSTDVFARLGGEEFAVLVAETDLGSALVIAEKIRNAVESRCFDRAGKVTVSCGVTEFKEGDLVDSFMKRVDDALYKAKKDGRNRVEALSLLQWIPLK